MASRPENVFRLQSVELAMGVFLLVGALTGWRARARGEPPATRAAVALGTICACTLFFLVATGILLLGFYLLFSGWSYDWNGPQ